MNNTIVLLFLFLAWDSSGQCDLNDISSISKSNISWSEVVRVSSGYSIMLTSLQGHSILYMIDDDGFLIDSFDLIDNGFSPLGMITENNLQPVYIGICSDTANFYSQRYCAAIFEDNLRTYRKIEFPINPEIAKGTLEFYQTSDGVANRRYNYHIYQDTLIGLGSYILYDSLLNFVGTTNLYFKGTNDGVLHVNDKEVLGNLYNVFYDKYDIYVMGSISEIGNSGNPRPVGKLKGNGIVERSWFFDDYGSGEFPKGSGGGGFIDDKLFFSYLSRDPTIAGCPENNVAIDIRDQDFNVIRRFKIDECGYEYAGNMPFVKSKDGNIYFQAVNSDYRSFIIQKYTPNLELIWSKEFESDNDFFIMPLQILSTDDDGVFVHIRQELNGTGKIRLIKLAGNGEPVSTIDFDLTDEKGEQNYLYPNPCTDIVNYTGKENGLLEAQIISLDGRMVVTKNITDKTINVSDLNTGLYTVLIYNKDSPMKILHRQTLVKQN